MEDDITNRLERFGFYKMNEEGEISEYEINPLAKAALDEINRIRVENEDLKNAITQQSLLYSAEIKNLTEQVNRLTDMFMKL